MNLIPRPVLRTIAAKLLKFSCIFNIQQMCLKRTVKKFSDGNGVTAVSPKLLHSPMKWTAGVIFFSFSICRIFNQFLWDKRHFKARKIPKSFSHCLKNSATSEKPSKDSSSTPSRAGEANQFEKYLDARNNCKLLIVALKSTSWEKPSRRCT